MKREKFYIICKENGGYLFVGCAASRSKRDKYLFDTFGNGMKEIENKFYYQYKMYDVLVFKSVEGAKKFLKKYRKNLNKLPKKYRDKKEIFRIKKIYLDPERIPDTYLME